MRYLVMLTLLAACDGGGDDPADDTDVSADGGGLAGMWAITGEWENQGSCSGKGEQVAMPTPYLRLADNAGTVELTFCSGLDSCLPTPDWYLGVDGEAWLEETHSGYYSEENGCVSFYTERVAELVEGELKLKEENWQRYDLEVTSERKCLDEEVPDFFGSGGDCTSSRTLTAVKE
jgi:hypothetical protein